MDEKWVAVDELGIDPRTSRMLSERSTTELHALMRRCAEVTSVNRGRQVTTRTVVRFKAQCLYMGHENVPAPAEIRTRVASVAGMHDTTTPPAQMLAVSLRLSDIAKPPPLRVMKSP